MIRINGYGALSGKMLLIRIVENNKIDAYVINIVSIKMIIRYIIRNTDNCYWTYWTTNNFFIKNVLGAFFRSG